MLESFLASLAFARELFFCAFSWTEGGSYPRLLGSTLLLSFAKDSCLQAGIYGLLGRGVGHAVSPFAEARLEDDREADPGDRDGGHGGDVHGLRIGPNDA